MGVEFLYDHLYEGHHHIPVRLKNIAFFDFDGTITNRDTMLEIIRFHFGDFKFALGFVILAPYIVGLKLRIVSNQVAKEKLLSYFFKGMSENEFDRICNSFFNLNKDRLIRPEAFQKINDLKQRGFEIVIVTASPSAWVRYWAQYLQVEMIASEMQVADGKITGKLKGLNCNFSEKVSRIKKQYQLEEFGEIHCFGDSAGDREMLAIATHPFYRRFD